MTSFLPAGYQQVEYIQSDGNQYIDTGILASSLITKIECDVEKTSAAGTPSILFGLYGGGNDLFYMDYSESSVTTHQSAFGYGAYPISYLNTGLSNAPSLVHLIFEHNGTSLRFSANTAIATATNECVFSSSYTHYLFACNSQGTKIYGYPCKMYNLKVWVNGAIVRNYIPARNSSNVYGLYDVVNNTWNPSASGSFSGGADIGVNLTPLPPTYQKCKYIQGTGTQYLNFGNYAGEFSCKYSASWQTAGYIIGSHLTSDPCERAGGYLRALNSDWELGYGNIYPQTTAYSTLPNTIYNVEFSVSSTNAYLKVDGNTIITTSGQTLNTSKPLLGFACGYFNHSQLIAGNCTSAKLYYGKIYNASGTLIRNLIPCFRKADGVVGMYDSVNDVFYQNAGSGTFSFEIDTEITFEKIVYQGTDLTQIKKGSEVVWKSENGVPYLTFSSPSSFTLAIYNSTKNWDGTLEYSTDTANWYVWDGTTTLSSVNNYLYLRGTGNTYITGSFTNRRFVITGANVSCIGSIENLLDYASVKNGNHPSMTNVSLYCLFFRCTALIKAPNLPSTNLSTNCYRQMFTNCTSLVNAPELPATNLPAGCYNAMFFGCTSLISIPKLPATSFGQDSCGQMFGGCTSIKISETQTGEYQTAYRIPVSGTATEESGALSIMFSNTGGTFTGTPTINTTYYTSNPVV